MLIGALGITWILDGLEVTIIGAIGGVLQDKQTLHLTAGDIGAVGSFYVAGAVVGALVFGWLADRFGRRKIFYATLGLYLAGVGLSACAWSFWNFAAFRLLTGLGIGGEYAAINSAIDEMMPARLRGRIDLAINGTYWLGAAAGAAATLVLLDPHIFPVNVGWRLGFAIGAVFSACILFLRRFVPESPRWLVTHGYAREAEDAMRDIERYVMRGDATPPGEAKEITIHPRKSYGLGLIARVMFGKFRARAAMVTVLMAAQAFLYNALFFTYALVLTKFYHVNQTRAGIFLLPLAVGNFLGPVLLGHFFDTIGRRRMIAATYGVAGILLTLTGYLFAAGHLTATTQTLAWAAIFFFASAAASAAYLTASEIFPLEMRALAIAIFYALGTAIGGIAAPLVFGALIGTGSPWMLFWGYAAASVFMLVAAGVALKYGVDAEGKSLEDVAEPLSAED